MTHRLDGRVAVIFGGGQIPGETVGNGRASAQLLAEHGAAIVAADIDLAGAEETLERVREIGGEGLALRCDVLCEDDIVNVMDATVERFGGFDIVYNNVGVSPGDGPVAQLELETWDFIMNANVRSMMLATKHAAPHLAERGGGVIINMSSMMSIAADAAVYSEGVADGQEPGSLAYRVSKTAVNSLTESTALSLAPHNIRVNAILPGLMDTPSGIETLAADRSIDRDVLRAERDAKVPLGRRQGTSQDVANAVLFLVSDEARFITGALLPVDGGQLLRIG